MVGKLKKNTKRGGGTAEVTRLGTAGPWEGLPLALKPGQPSRGSGFLKKTQERHGTLGILGSVVVVFLISFFGAA